MVFVPQEIEAKPKASPEREQVEVAGVLDTEGGQFVVVLRTRQEPHRYLPIWIGEVEALNIRLRMQGQEPPRPLTLNLLENVLASGNIQVTEIAIDDVRGGVFLGRVVLKQSGRTWQVDARPSDAIGLAVGQKVPIWVSRDVIENAGVDPSTLEEPPKAAVDYSETL